MEEAKKSLGQHWLTDEPILEAIVESAQIQATDTVLEIGPGLGHLTDHLLKKTQNLIAIEKDEELAAKLQAKYAPRALSILTGDILKFDLSQLPTSYKVVANIPYYLTSNLLRTLSESTNPPETMVLLVQQEVAERICAEPGQMSLLAISVQLYYDCELGIKVPADKFVPPPKVDSQVVICRRRKEPLFKGLETDKFFRTVKAGFSERRKKLRSSLAGGLNMPKDQVDELLQKAGINGDLRAQNLNLEDWYQLYKNF